MFGLDILEIFMIMAYMVIQIVGWIYLIVDSIVSLIKCKNCGWRKDCKFLIFSEHCPKRYCISDEERKEIQEKIQELD